MLLLGLTGSIATGKSTVSQILQAPPYNLPIVDADKISRQVVEPGTAGYKKIVDTFGHDTPMKRPGQPEEVAPAYVYLASTDSSYVTGQTIHINGGEVVGG